MAYSKTTWVTGDVVTATKLNHAEDGIATAQSTAEGAAASVAALGANGAIGTANLEDGAVTDEKLAASGVKSDVADLKSAVEKNSSVIFDPIGNGYFAESIFSSGYISSTGAEGNNSKNSRSVYIACDAISAIQIPLGYKIKFAWYTSTSQSGFISIDSTYKQCGSDVLNYLYPPSNAKYFRMVLINNAVTDISDADRIELSQSIVFYSDYKRNAETQKADYIIDAVFSKQVAAADGRSTFLLNDGYVTSNGNFGSDSRYCRTSGISLSKKNIAVSVDSDFVIRAAFYNSSSQLIGSVMPLRYYAEKYYLEAPDSTAYVVFDFHAKDWRTLTSADKTTVQNSFAIYYSILPDAVSVILNNDAKAAFVTYMNAMCAKLGMSDTTFTNASGLLRTNVTTAQDELKMAIAVAGNPKALDIWSTKDRDFTIGGKNPRTVSVVNNVYDAEPEGALYKLLGGKGGSLFPVSEDNQYRKGRVAIYDVNGTPVAVALLGKGEWTYNNMTACTHELLGMVANKLNGETATQGENLTHLVTDGGGYAAVPVPVCASAYVNAYTPSELSSRANATKNNATASEIPASTTKTMTLLCALSVASDLQEIVTVNSIDISSGSGSAFANGDTLTLEDALRIMMMESSNTLAETVGRHIGKMLLTTQRTH